MLHERREQVKRLDWPRMQNPNLMAQLRLFGLLALLIPLYAGLQFVVREGVPRVEVRLVAQDVQTTVPVEVPVERVVERVVYVPVGGQMTVPPTSDIEPARAIQPIATGPVDAPDVQVADRPPADEPGREPESSEPSVVAEGDAETPSLTGSVALAPPPAPIRAAPVVRTVPVAAPPVEEDAADQGEAVAEADEPEDDGEVVAEIPPTARVAELTPHFEAGMPVPPETQRAAIEFLRRERAAHEPHPEPTAVAVVEEPAVEPEADNPAAEATTEEGAADESAPTEEAAADEPESSEPVADGDAPIGEEPDDASPAKLLAPAQRADDPADVVEADEPEQGIAGEADAPVAAAPADAGNGDEPVVEIDGGNQAILREPEGTVLELESEP